MPTMGGGGGGGGGGGANGGSCGVGAWSVDSARAGAREMLAPTGMAPRSCGIVPAIPVSPQRTGAVRAGAGGSFGILSGGSGGFDMLGFRERLD